MVPRELHDFDEFLHLSERLTFHWTLGLDNVLTLILDGKPISERDRALVCSSLAYLRLAYGSRTRRLGTLSVLHPLRAATLLARVLDRVQGLELAVELLHDKLEDIDAELSERTPSEREVLSRAWQAVQDHLDRDGQWYLRERLDWLTRPESETYQHYVGRCLDHYRQTPEVVRCKLADRLDNSMDLRIALADPACEQDFHLTMFEVMFLDRTFKGYRPATPHDDNVVINGADRLYQLFKNAVVLSLIRYKRLHLEDPPANRLFNALVVASKREAERVLMHIWGYHYQDVSQQRALVIDTMEYVRSGGIDRVSAGHHRLDGLFATVFDAPDRPVRKERLKILYKNKELMIEAALAFVILFMRFELDPDYYVKGITDQGIAAVE
jgi:hypothetical protein